MEINLLLQLNQVQFATTWKTQYAYTQKQREKNSSNSYRNFNYASGNVSH